MKVFKISLSNGEIIVIPTFTNKKLIDVIDHLTKEKYTKIYECGEFSEVIFRKHIVKITEVK